MRISLVTLFLAGLFLSCTPGPSGPGYTQCGGTVCQPGQYCESAALDLCTNGCTSDANCVEGSTCEGIDDVSGEGTCSETGGGGEGEGEGEGEEGDPLEDCRAGCDAAGECGMGAADVSLCRTDCEGLNEQQQISIGNCQDEICGDPILSCFGVDCFSADDCGAGEDCLDFTCL